MERLGGRTNFTNEDNKHLKLNDSVVDIEGAVEEIRVDSRILVTKKMQQDFVEI